MYAYVYITRYKKRVIVCNGHLTGRKVAMQTTSCDLTTVALHTMHLLTLEWQQAWCHARNYVSVVIFSRSSARGR